MRTSSQYISIKVLVQGDDNDDVCAQLCRIYLRRNFKLIYKLHCVLTPLSHLLKILVIRFLPLVYFTPAHVIADS